MHTRGTLHDGEAESVNAPATTGDGNLHRFDGWLLSLVLHGLALFAALPLLRQLPITAPAESFRWDVTLVHSSEIRAETTPPAETSEPFPISVPAETDSALQETAETAEPQPPAPAPTMARIETASAAQDPPPALRHVTEEPAQSIPASAEQSVSALRTSDPPVQQTEPPAAATLQDQPAPPAVAAGSDTSSVPSTEAVHAPSQTASVSAQTDPASATRADYGWLQRALFQRLEELKRSSRPSLDQSRPLKVLVKAVVSDEGALMEAQVVKSSGLDRIDQEAMALVQRAFPMQLDRTLDRRQIVIRIPIIYSRD